MNGEAKTTFLPVEGAYDRWAASYDSYDNPMVFMASPAISRSMSDLTGARVFEFGCGTGRNLARLISLGAASVAGCELPEGMPTIARRRRPEAELFRQDMTEPIPGVKATVADLALFSLTLEHVCGLITPLSQAPHVLVPGGRIAIFEIHPFLSLSGVAAHFEDGGERCGCEWRPCDIGAPATLRTLKRGPDFPLLVEFLLELQPAD